ncbi:Tetratricopeptide-like helical [Penicillium desertorum]|uniref:Tetratricopeptide-like helical n=1 Tax=Penicillium desertorum TaxID=1303715 RepID=A0A9W9WMX9_9EURO|nr:Tetratricopeptide-like helical [Penicillium desertorum]
MEVVGVVAAIPSLLKMLQWLTTTIRGLSKKKHAAKAAVDLIVQLQGIEAILKDVQLRWKDSPLSLSQLQGLSPILAQLQTELSSLQSTLQTKSAKEPRRFLRKAMLISTGLDKALEKSLVSLCQLKTSLTLIIAHHHDKVAEKLLGISSDELRLKLRALLRPSGDSFIPKRLEHTCEWIWSHATFTKWLDNQASTPRDDMSRILCIYGVKGCGKSVLVKSIAEELRNRRKIASHFTFWAGSETQRKILDLLRTLLWQLLSYLPESETRQLTRPLINDTSINESNLLKAIQGALGLVKSNLYCIVDGIDESTDDWNNPRDGPLQTVLDLVKSHPRLYLLMSGREASMRTLLKGSSPRLELIENLTRGDINKLIASELDSALTIQTPEIKALAQKSLEEKSQVMFLWTTLISKELRRCFSVEEIRRTLDQVPHDLDREYHRLLLQQMTRTGGTTTKPSTSMKRARLLLFSIFASPEPLAADELCYAYAAQLNRGGRIEDDLISVDGIIDACGDLVRLTEGRYHLIHNSVADFLTRPEMIETGDISWVQSKILQFVRTPQFCALVEYLFVILQRNLQDNEIDQFYHWTELVHVKFQWETLDLVEVYEKELQRRLQCFGAHDDRYLSWQSASVLVLIYCRNWSGSQSQSITENSSSYSRPSINTDSLVNTSSRSSKNLVARGLGLPQHMTRAHGRAIEMLSKNIYALTNIFGNMTDLLSFSLDSLPVPMLLLMQGKAFTAGEYHSAVRLAAIAVKKTANKGNQWESLSLLELGASMYYIGPEKDEEAIELLRRAIQMTDRLHPRLRSQPQIYMEKSHAYTHLVCLLIRQNKLDEAKTMLRVLESIVGKDRDESESRLWESFCRTQGGVAVRMKDLRKVADQYYSTNNFADAAGVMAEAMAVWENSGSKSNIEVRTSLETQRNALFSANEPSQCLVVSRRLLDFLKSDTEGKQPEKNDIHLRRQTCALAASSSAALGNMNEAITWYCQSSDDARLLDVSKESHDCLWDLYELAIDLALIGEYDRSSAVCLKVLEMHKISYEDRENAKEGFRNLEALVTKLQQVELVGSGYKEFLDCFSLLKAKEELTYLTAEVDWWIKIATLIEVHHVTSFRGQKVLPYLKAIDTSLCASSELKQAVSLYRALAEYSVEVGNRPAAELLWADATAQCFAKPIQGFVEGLILLSDAALHNRRFRQRKLLIGTAYANCACDCYDDWDEESYFAGEHVDDVEHLARIADVSDEMRLFYLETACAHVARARKASNAMDVRRFGNWWSRDKDEIEEDEYEAEEREAREGLIIDLERRLRDVGGGLLLDKAIQSKAQPLRKQPRRIKSFAGLVEAKPQTCWRNYSQSRSWELLPGLPG